MPQIILIDHDFFRKFADSNESFDERQQRFFKRRRTLVERHSGYQVKVMELREAVAHMIKHNPNTVEFIYVAESVTDKLNEKHKKPVDGKQKKPVDTPRVSMTMGMWCHPVNVQTITDVEAGITPRRTQEGNRPNTCDAIGHTTNEALVGQGI